MHLLPWKIKMSLEKGAFCKGNFVWNQPTIFRWYVCFHGDTHQSYPVLLVNHITILSVWDISEKSSLSQKTVRTNREQLSQWIFSKVLKGEQMPAMNIYMICINHVFIYIYMYILTCEGTMWFLTTFLERGNNIDPKSRVRTVLTSPKVRDVLVHLDLFLGLVFYFLLWYSSPLRPTICDNMIGTFFQAIKQSQIQVPW